MGEVSAPAARVPVRRGGVALGAAALLTLLAACRTAEAPPQAGRAREPAETVAASGSAAAPDAGGIDAACELAAWVVDDALGVEAEPAGEPMSDLLADGEDDGCRLTAAGSFADLPEEAETPIDLLWESFEGGGWHEDLRYAADTEESSAIGMWKSGVLCVMGALWAAPEEHGYAPEPAGDELRYDVMIECVSAEAPPIPLSGLMA